MWKCDVCGQDIVRAEDGWVEALCYQDAATGELKERGLRLVHAAMASPRGRAGCQYNQEAEYAKGKATVVDLGLPVYLGREGLARLRQMLRDGSARKEEVEAMIKRLHPGAS